jgi:hypothetical protein
VQKQPSQPWPLLAFYSDRNKILIRPAYQRNFIWNREQQQELIDTILRGGYIPELVGGISTDKEYENGYEYEMVDGQQRISTIFKFMSDELKIAEGTVIERYDSKGRHIGSVDLSNKTYSELPPNYKTIVDSFVISIAKLVGKTDEIETMYRKLQGGSQLNKAEYRRSFSGSIRDFVSEMIKHKFFQESIGANEKKNRRLVYDEVIQQVLLLELYGLTDVKAANIKQMFKQYNNKPIDKTVKERIAKIFDYMYAAFGKDYKKHFKKTTIQELYLVLSEFIKKDKDAKYAKQFATWWADFQEQFKVQKALPASEREEQFAEYIRFGESGTGTKEFLEGRRDILLESWREWLENKEQVA